MFRGMNRTSFYEFLGYFLECHTTNLMCWARVYKPNHSENTPSSVNEQNVSLHIAVEQWQWSWNKSQSHNGVLIWAKSPWIPSSVLPGDLCIPCGFQIIYCGSFTTGVAAGLLKNWSYLSRGCSSVPLNSALRSSFWSPTWTFGALFSNTNFMLQKPLWISLTLCCLHSPFTSLT